MTGAVALEIGAGPYGETVLLHDILKCQLVVTGFDEKKSDVAIYKKDIEIGSGSSKIKIPYANFNIESHTWPFPNEYFDLIIADQVFEHLALDPVYALYEANRVLKKGGLIYISIPNGASAEHFGRLLAGEQPSTFPYYRPKGINLRHNREPTPNDIKEMLTATGFEIETLASLRLSSDAHMPGWLLWLVQNTMTKIGLRRPLLIAIARKVSTPITRMPKASRLYYESDSAPVIH